MATLFRDLHYALRALKRRPALTLTAIVSLALGIGANTAIFSVFDAVVLKPLPLPESSQVYAIQATRNGQTAGGNPARLLDWGQRVPSFSGAMAAYTDNLTLTGQGPAQKLRALRTFGDPFAVTGYRPEQGRPFTADENRGTGVPVAAITAAAQARLFGTAPALGRVIALEGKPVSIVAVLPPGAGFPSDVDLWVPAPADLNDGNRRAGYTLDIVRLKPGVSEQQAALELAAVQQNLARQYPATDAGLQPRLRPLLDTLTDEYRTPLLLILAVVGFVLLIACLNISCLLLARSTERERESAIRASLGAGRSALLRLYLTESLLLSLLGGGAGVLVAVYLLELLKRLAPVYVLRLDSATLDWRVLSFAVVLSLLAGVIFGVVPAWMSARVNLAPQMTRTRRRPWVRTALVMAEVAVSLTLLVGAGTLLEAFLRMRSQPLGFQPSQLLTARVDFPWTTPKSNLDSFYTQALENIAAIPGVRAVGLADRLPLQGGSQDRPLSIAGKTLPPELTKKNVPFRAVSNGYFQALGVPLLAGQWHRSSGSVLVNEAFARKYFGAENPLGQQIMFEGDRANRAVEIVGVVADIRQQAVQNEQPPEVFTLIQETYWPMASFVIRAQGDPAQIAQAIQEQFRRLDPNSPPRPVTSLEATLNDSFAQPRQYAVLIGGLALTALLLAAIGIQGVMASEVATRTQEIGIRMALGAQPEEARRVVLAGGMKLVAGGALAGLAGGAILSRLLETLPVGAKAYHPLALTMATLFLVLTALAACWIPARRATRVDPIRALRHD